MTVTSEFITPTLLSTIYVRVKQALVGLEKLSDADAAAYLNAHPAVVVQCPWMPGVFTTAMITEVRKQP
jgi:hypothetical protein